MMLLRDRLEELYTYRLSNLNLDGTIDRENTPDMSLKISMTQRTAAVLARNRKIAQTAFTARRALSGDTKDNGKDQPEK